MAVPPPDIADPRTDTGESHCAEPSSPPTASLGYDPGSFVLQDGKRYPRKTNRRKLINCGHSLEDTTSYVATTAAKALVSGSNVNEQLPHHSTADYVNTIYQATCSRLDSKFTFANKSVRYLDQIAVGLNSVPPGYVFRHPQLTIAAFGLHRGTL